MDYQSKLEAFRQLVNAHDLTYQYSDDQSVWRRGSAEHTRIIQAANELQREDARRIWNEVVDQKLVEAARKDFYWSE